MENATDGVVIQTETDVAVRNRAVRMMRLASVRALADAQKRYQADVVQNLAVGWKFTTDLQKSGDAQKYF